MPQILPQKTDKLILWILNGLYLDAMMYKGSFISCRCTASHSVAKFCHKVAPVLGGSVPREVGRFSIADFSFVVTEVLKAWCIWSIPMVAFGTLLLVNCGSSKYND